MKKRTVALLGFLAAIGLSIASFSVVAQEAEAAAPIEVPENLTRAEVRDLVARLSDGQVRELIIQQLDRIADEDSQLDNQLSYAEQISQGFEAITGILRKVLASSDRIQDTYTYIWQQLTDNGRIGGWMLLLQLIGLLVTGWAGYRLTRHKLGLAVAKPVEVESLGKRFDLACYGMAMGLIELAGFVVGAVIFVEIVTQQLPAAQYLWYQTIWYIALLWTVMLITIKLMSPDAEQYRLAAVTDRQAKQVCKWVFILTAVLFFPASNLVERIGGDQESELLSRIVDSGIFILLLLWVLFRLRQYGAALILGEDGQGSSRLRQSLASVWWLLAMLYIVLIWLMSMGKHIATGESSLVEGLFSLFLVAVIPYLNIGLKWLIAYYFREKEPDQEESPAEPIEAAATGETAAAAGIVESDQPDAGLQPAAAAEMAEVAPAEIVATDLPGGPPEPAVAAELAEAVPAAKTEIPEYQLLSLRYARVLMLLVVAALFLRTWSIDIEALSGALIGEHLATVLYEIGLTIVLAWAFWGVIRVAIERKLAEEKGDVDESEEAEIGGLGGSRVETLLPLIRASIKITIIVMATLLSLSTLGVNIGPLIAGAGVIGLAIGFGAQTLVRDVVSGFFYLVDDAFRIGEYVVVGDIRGTVEKISVRSFQLRHHNGPVHTIPYGDIATLTNYSRDWAIMKLELRLPFETDIEMVRKIIKKIGQEMIADPQFGQMLLQPVKSQGVNRMDDSALIIRVKFMTIPGQQYLIRREVFTRIQRVFEEKGIHFAPKRVLVEASTPEDAIKGGAALAAAEMDKQNQPAGQNTP